MLKDKIKSGIAVLDSKSPDWHWRVNVNSLFMDYECNCVLGQLYGNYTHGKSMLNIDDVQAYDLGLLSWWQRGYNWKQWLSFVGCRLNKAWKKAILGKRAVDTFSHSLERSTRALELEQIHMD